MSYRLLYDHTSKKLQTAKRALTRLADIFNKPFFEEIRLNACFVVNLYLIGNYRIRYNNSLLTSLFHADFSFVSKQSFESDSQKLKPIGPIKSLQGVIFKSLCLWPYSLPFTLTLKIG